MLSEPARDITESQPLEWVFEAHDEPEEEVLSPPASAASNSWLGWLQGTPAPKPRNLSRESDASATSLPPASEPSRDPEHAAPPAKHNGFGLLGWMTGQAFADEEDNPLPPPLPSRLDREDEESVRHSAPSQHVKWSVEVDIPDDMLLDDEVIPERNVGRTRTASSSMPPASALAASSTAAPRHREDAYRPQKAADSQVPFDPALDRLVRKDTYSDAFLEQFDSHDAAEAVAAVTAQEDLVPPPLPPPSEPPQEEEQGFFEMHQQHASNDAALVMKVGQAAAEEAPQEETGHHPSPIPEERPEQVAVAVAADPAEAEPVQSPEEPSAGGKRGCCARLKACCSSSGKKKVEQDPEKLRQQQSKLLDEEIEDFSSTPLVGCVAWISHRGMAKLPTCCVFVGLLIVLGVIAGGMVSLPPEVDVDWDSFLKTDVNTSTMRDVFLFALQNRQTERRLHEVSDELTEDRRLQGGNRLYKHSDIFLSYDIPEGVSAGAHGFLDAGFLSRVRSFEKALRSSPEWAVQCNRTDDVDRPLCEQGISLVNYVYPSPVIAGPDVVPSLLVYDAGGAEKVAPQVAVALMEEHGVKDIIVPAAYEEGTPLRSIRTVFRFKWYCCTSLQSASEQRVVLDEMRVTWETFLEAAVIPLLKEFREDLASDSSGMAMYYTGTTLYSKEVFDTLMGDLLLACGSMGFVLFYLIFHTQSLLLGTCGLFIIVSAIPFSYVLFAVLTGSNKMSIASLLSVFLIVGLGSDVVFVYTDFWADSKHRKENFGSRMTWTLIHAGKASLATSVTTALSFFANLVSVLKPLREFGFFMGLCVVVVWVLLSLIYVPLCMVSEYWCRRCKLPCGRVYKSMTGGALESPRKAHKTTNAYPAMSMYARCVQKFKISITLFPVVLGIGFVVWAAMVVEVDTGVPSIFPEDHNLNKGQKVFATFNAASEVFSPLWTVGTPQVSVCNDAMFAPLTSMYTPGSWGYNCNLFWCEANPDVEQSEEGSCHCWRKQLPATCSSITAPVSSKIYAPRKLQQSEVEGYLGDYWSGTEGMRLTDTQRRGMERASVLAPIVTEEWERGSKEVREITEVVSRLEREDLTTSSCGFQDMCFCTSWSCKMLGSDWQKVDMLSFPTLNTSLNLTARRLQPSGPETSEPWEPEPPQRGHKAKRPGRSGVWSAKASQEVARRLQTQAAEEEEGAPPRWLQNLSPSEWTVSPANRATIDVVFGIEVTTTAKLLGEVDLENGWIFGEMHQVSQPWAQRNMYSFCTNFPKELRIAERRCWMEDFRAYLLDRGDRFPIVASQFEQLIIPFAESWLTGMHSTKDYLWIRDGQVKASYAVMNVDFHRYADTGSAIEYKKLWDEYLFNFNLDASIYTKGAWHTSSLWVRAEAQSALISSTILTIVIVVALALMGMLIFTRDWKLSLFVVTSTMLVIFALLWFIVVVMGWPIGPIEVIALIVFIGYAVTYSLHIAHRYGSSDAQEALATAEDDATKRFIRTVFALGSIGRAALGSAATTAGCSIFLVFCTLTIFKKLGGVVLVVTLMSIGVALIPLPAALLWAGPLRPGFCWCLRPMETWDNIVNARANMVSDLEKRKQKKKEEGLRKKSEKEEKHRQEKDAKAENERLEQEAKESKRNENEEETPASKEEEEAQRKKEAEEARRKELAAKAKQIAAAKAKAKAAAAGVAKTPSKPESVPASGPVPHLVQDTKPRPRSRSDGAGASPVGATRSMRSQSAGGAPPVETTRSMRSLGAPPVETRLSQQTFDVGEEESIANNFQASPLLKPT